MYFMWIIYFVICLLRSDALSAHIFIFHFHIGISDPQNAFAPRKCASNPIAYLISTSEYEAIGNHWRRLFNVTCNMIVVTILFAFTCSLCISEILSDAQQVIAAHDMAKITPEDMFCLLMSGFCVFFILYLMIATY